MNQDGTWHGGRPQPRRLCARWGPSPPPQKGGRAPSPIFGPFLVWPNGWMHQDATWYGGRPQPMGQCVRWGPRPLPKKGAEPPIFGPCLLRPNGCMDQDATWYGGRPRPRRHCVRWGPNSLPQKGAEPPSPIFGPSLLSIWPVSIGWIKMAPISPIFGIFIVAKRLDASRCVLDGDSAPPPLKEHSPQFSANVRCGQTAGWTKMSIGMEVGLAQATLCSIGTQLPREKNGTPTPPNFWPMSIVAKRLDG